MNSFFNFQLSTFNFRPSLVRDSHLARTFARIPSLARGGVTLTPIRSLRGRGSWGIAAIVALLLLVVAAPARAQTIWYVDNTANGADNGTTWTNALPYLRPALDAAAPGDQIWVASGVYKPTEGAPASELDPLRVRRVTFTLPPGVRIYGGFPNGGGNGTFAARGTNPLANGSVLTGDLLGNDQPGDLPSDQNNYQTGLSYTDNAYHVANASESDEATLLDGFTIRGGNANGSATIPEVPPFIPANIGGGLIDTPGAGAGALTIRNCRFEGNAASATGGAVHAAAAVLLDTCIFVGNHARGTGGAVHVSNVPDPGRLTECTFENNTARGAGGAISISGGNPELNFCNFLSNSSTGTSSKGGAIYISDGGMPDFINGVFVGNSGYAGGGAVFGAAGTRARLANCLVARNSTIAGDGGGLDLASGLVNNCTIVQNQASGTSPNSKGGGLNSSGTSAVQVTNTILWNNSATDPNANHHSGSPTITYSCVEGGASGSGNIPSDPAFVYPGGPDPNGADGEYGTSDDIFQVQVTSPCNDSGTNAVLVPGYPTSNDSFRIPIDLAGNFRWGNDPKAPDTGNLAGLDLCPQENRNPQPAGPCGHPNIIDMGAYEYYAAAAPFEIIYVDKNVEGGDGGGSSWANAMPELRDALDFVQGQSTIKQIWVADGTYKPTAGNDRTVAFLLVNGVAVYGGFAGRDSNGYPNGETRLDQRDPSVNLTILSGDLLDNDGPDFANYGDNSVHVVDASGTDDTALLEHVTIERGSADVTGNVDRTIGGGLFVKSGRPQIRNCRFRLNLARNAAETEGGGGAVGLGSTDPQFPISSPRFVNCRFEQNESLGGGAGYSRSTATPTFINCEFIANRTAGAFAGGGGVFVQETGPGGAAFQSCQFTGNAANLDGGALSLNGSTTTIDDCAFTGNTAIRGGGAILNTGSSANLTVSNCRFTGNTSGSYGGALLCQVSAGTSVVNCTFEQNFSTAYGGAIYCTNTSNTGVTNSIIRGNVANTYGGGAYLADGAYAAFRNCLFSANRAGQGGGGLNMAQDGINPSTSVVNCTFAGNEAANTVGSAIHIGNGTATIVNSILWGNVTYPDRTLYISPGSNSGATISYSLIEGIDGPVVPTMGTGNLDAGENPLYADADGPDNVVRTEDDDLRLRLDSPCIDAGNGTALPTDSSDLDGDEDEQEPIPFDLDGRPRVAAGEVDMGAYEAIADCNSNGIDDLLDIAGPQSGDCNLSDVPDECEIGTVGQVTVGVGVLNSNASTDGAIIDRDVSLATDRRETWVAVWRTPGGEEGPQSSIWVSRSFDNGSSWSPPQALTASDSNQHFWPNVSTDGQGTWLIVWARVTPADPDSDIWFTRSTDGGENWTAPQPLNAHFQTDVGYDDIPRAAADGQGNWIVVWMTNTTFGGPVADLDIAIVRSFDGGATWTIPQRLDGLAASDAYTEAVPDIVCDGQGQWLVAWESNNTPNGTSGSDIYVSRSNDLGATWSDPVILNSNAGTDDAGDGKVRLATDREGAWVAVWSTIDGVLGSDSDILVARSTNNGTTWSAAESLNAGASADTNVSDGLPVIATDGAGNWVALWVSQSPASPNNDVLMSASTDAGESWADSVPIHDNFATDAGEDTRPQIAVDLNGNWAVVWQSQENIGGTIGSDYDILVSRFRTIGDCNSDGVLDQCELANGAPDSNSNLLPDICESDCNSNLTPDLFEADFDRDTIIDDCDNCVNVANPGQDDADTDGVGDLCDVCHDGDDNIDTDTDGIAEDCDNCPAVLNSNQADSDSDGAGDACDNCPEFYNPTQIPGANCQQQYGLGSRLDPPSDIGAVSLPNTVVSVVSNYTGGDPEGITSWSSGLTAAFYHSTANAWYAIDAGLVRMTWRDANGEELRRSYFLVEDEVGPNEWTVGVKYFLDYNEGQFDKDADVVIGTSLHATIRYNSRVLQRRQIPGTGQPPNNPNNPVQYYQFPDFHISGNRATAEDQDGNFTGGKVVIQYDDGPGGEFVGFEVVDIQTFGTPTANLVPVGRRLPVPPGADDCRAVFITNFEFGGTPAAWQRGFEEADVYPLRPEPFAYNFVVAWYKASILPDGTLLNNCWPHSITRHTAEWPEVINTDFDADNDVPPSQVHVVDTDVAPIPEGARVDLHVGAGDIYCGAEVMYQSGFSPLAPPPLSRVVNGIFEAVRPGYSVIRFDKDPGGSGLCGDEVTFEVVASYDHFDQTTVPYTMDEEGTANDRKIYAAQPVEALIGDQIMDCDHPIACATCEGPQACDRLRPDCTEPRDCFDPGGSDGPQYAHGFLRSGKPYAANIYSETGQIFPVNATAMYPQARDGLLEVWWYARSRETQDCDAQSGTASGNFACGIYWPHKVRDYNAVWPPEPSDPDEAKEIVIASRLGGVTSGFEEDPETHEQVPTPKRYDQYATVYHAGTFENRAGEMLTLPGWNPNDEHALLLPIASSYRVFAVRDDDPWDLNRLDGQVTHGHPWVLVQFPAEGDDPLNPELYGMDVFRVVAEDAIYRLDYANYVAQNDPSVQLPVLAGQKINPLFPVNFASPECFDPPILPRIMPVPQTYVIGDAVWVDNKGGVWAVERSGDGIDQQPDDGRPSTGLGEVSDADVYLWENWAPDGGCQPWRTYGHDPQDQDFGNEPYPITYRPSWPPVPPACSFPNDAKCARPLKVGESVDQSGQCGTITVLHDSVGQRILDPTLWVGEDVDTDGIDEDVPLSPTVMDNIDFAELPPHLYAGEIGGGGEWPDRIRYNQNGRSRLEFRGIMSDRDRVFLRQLGRPDPDTDICEVPEYCAAIDELYTLSRRQLTAPIAQPASKHVTVGDIDAKPGWITVAYQNDETCVAQGLPVSVEVWNVACPPYRSEIRVIQPECMFSEKLILQFAGDLGGESENFVFQWQWANDPTGPWNDYNPPEDYLDGRGLREIIIEGASEFTLADSYWRVRYRGYDGCPCVPDQRCDCQTPIDEESVDCGTDGMYDCCPQIGDWAENLDQSLNDTQVSEWTAPQLAEGWVKRVVRGLNPFDQRFNRFHLNATSTFVDMIGQAGKRHEQDIALNCDPANLDAIGLIEAYSTVLNRAKKFSIELGISYDPANQAIQLAAGKVADLYMLLGNEAFADASDPTIGVFVGQGESGGGYDPHAVHCFEDQTASLLDEELALLRGQDDVRAPDRNADGQIIGTVYNRLPWNFTSGNGQIAYANNYQMIDVEQARQTYPQGHGDAWGHYLTAVQKFYDLLRHPVFDWVVDTEEVLVGGQRVEVGYKYERKFAAAAAAKARTGAAITSLTFREKYNADPSQQDGYPDNDDARAWGVADWGQRAGQGAYLDWVMANSLLPQEALICPETGQPCDPTDAESCEDQFCVPDPNVEQGIQKIDRGTVRELHEIAASYTEIQTTLDKADAGLNPLGLATNVVPFGLNPTAIEEGQTHFDQVYQRAVSALGSAVTCFNYANENTRRLRALQDEVEQFDDLVEERELDYEARLIEIFGRPYAEDIGPNGTYPTGYRGPDLYHYMYVDDSSVLGPRQNGRTTTIGVTFEDVIVDPATGAVSTSPRIVQYNVSEDGLGIIRPGNWRDRPEPGEIQFAQAEMVQAVLRYQQAVDRYEAHIEQIEGQADLLESLFNLNRNVLQVMRQGQATQQSLNDQILVARTLAQQFRQRGSTVQNIANAIAEGYPKFTIGGLAVGFDFTAVIRGALKYAASKLGSLLAAAADGLELSASQRQNDKEWASAEQQIIITGYQQDHQVEQQIEALRQLVRQTPSLRLEIYLLEEAIQQAAGRYQSALGRGLRHWEQRTAYRQRTADQTTRHRYRDMAFRIFRNDAIQKYLAQFDLAAQYVYLAAKVYDYETNLLGTHTLAGQQFLTNIVKERTLGIVEGGAPLPGNGLAGSLAKMFTNFNLVLRPQLGFNSPAEMNRRFSLRWEGERIARTTQFDPDWKAFLAAVRVSDINAVPEYQQFCKPLQASSPISPNPAIVIPFETTVQSGLNFFGRPSMADEVYPSSYDAIKLHSVGIRFLNYPTGTLNNQAEVYLIPLGPDILRVPTDGSIRDWHLLDQTLPVPFPLGMQQLQAPGWMPFDSLSGGSQAMIRRRLHPQITGLPVQGHEDEEDLRFHLTGRSVWNKWVLIIPGSELLGSNPSQGIDVFINGPSGSTVGVRDIQLLFNSYGYAGTARGARDGDAEDPGAGEGETSGDGSGSGDSGGGSTDGGSNDSP